jgi:hypothetical protein
MKYRLLAYLLLQKLHRKRGLGGGPYGSTHACFTPDEGSVVAAFQVSLTWHTLVPQLGVVL